MSHNKLGELSNSEDPVSFERIPRRYRMTLVTRDGHRHAFDARTVAQLHPDRAGRTLHPLTREPISRENLSLARHLAPGHAPPAAHPPVDEDNYSLARVSPGESFLRRHRAAHEYIMRNLASPHGTLRGYQAAYDQIMGLDSASSSRRRSRHPMVLRSRNRSPSPRRSSR